MTNFKKLLLPLSGAIIVASPLVVAVACSINSDDSPQVEIQVYTEYNEDSSALTISLKEADLRTSKLASLKRPLIINDIPAKTESDGINTRETYRNIAQNIQFLHSQTTSIKVTIDDVITSQILDLQFIQSYAKEFIEFTKLTAAQKSSAITVIDQARTIAIILDQIEKYWQEYKVESVPAKLLVINDLKAIGDPYQAFTTQLAIKSFETEFKALTSDAIKGQEKINEVGELTSVNIDIKESSSARVDALSASDLEVIGGNSDLNFIITSIQKVSGSNNKYNIYIEASLKTNVEGTISQYIEIKDVEFNEELVSVAVVGWIDSILTITNSDAIGDPGLVSIDISSMTIPDEVEIQVKLANEDLMIIDFENGVAELPADIGAITLRLSIKSEFSNSHKFDKNYLDIIGEIIVNPIIA